MSYRTEVTEIRPILRKGFNPQFMLRTEEDVQKAKNIIKSHYTRSGKTVEVEIRVINTNHIACPGVAKSQTETLLFSAVGRQ